MLLLLFVSSMNAQKGFRVEANIGSTLGDSREYYSFTLQGSLYYLWEASENTNIGVTTGGLVFLGDNKTEEDFNYDDYEPNLYIPLAMFGRADLSKAFSIGLDTGYAFLIHLYDDGGGFYFRPVIAYNLKEKLAFIGSYSNIFENGYTASTINLGVNIGF